MLRSGHVLTIHELRAQGKGIREIARITGHSKNTVKKYLRLRELPQPTQRQPRASKLDPFVDDIKSWLNEGIFNCEVMLEKLQANGYTAGRSIPKSFVKRFRPPHRPQAVTRYETGPGEQVQVDWGICKYKDATGKDKHL